MGLKRAVVSGALWNGVRNLVRQGVNSVAFFALAWFVSPAQFGLGSIAVASGMLAKLLMDRGLRDGTIQVPDLTEDYLATARQLNVLLGTALACILVAIGAFLVFVVDNVQLGWLVAVSGGIPLLAGFSSVPIGYLEREFQQRQLGLIQIAASCAAAGAALLLAWRGAGAWSVLAFNVAETGCLAIFTNMLVGRRPRLGFDMGLARRQIAFVWPIAIAGFLVGAFPRVALLTVGAAFGTVPAAQFRIGLQVYLLVTQLVAAPVARVILPAFSRHGGDVRNAYTKAISVYAGFSTPLFFGAAAVAPAVIHLALGSKWSEAGDLAGVLCFAAIGRFAAQPLDAALVIQGDSRAAMSLSMWTTAVGLVLIAGATAFGPYAVALALVAMGIAGLTLAAIFAKRRLGVAPWQCIGPVVVYSAAGLVTFAGARLTLASAAAVGPAAALALAIPVGAFLYLAMVRLAVRYVSPSAYQPAIDLMPARLRRFM